MFFKSHKILKWSIFLVLCFAYTASAFQINTLHLIVTDQNFESVPNLSVRLKNKKELIKEQKDAESHKVLFSKLETGKYVLEIEAKGFKPYSQEIEIKAGRNEISVKLEIAEIVENIDVERDGQDKALDPQDGAFSNFLTKDQIEALPEDPEELEKALKRQFGQDVLIRVDGFSGRMPPKSAISSIRIVRSSFDAEFHQLGNTVIDIISKAGGGKWAGTISFNFNDSHLNARDPFALLRLPAQQRKFNSFFYGPLVKGKTSALIMIDGENSYRQNNINAVTPNGIVKDSLTNSYSAFFPSIKISQNVGKTSLNIAYSGIFRNSSNDGVGGIDLSSRAFDSKTVMHQLRVSQSGYIGKRFLNEIRFQYTNENLSNDPRNDETTIIVLEAFNDGGAGNKYKSRKQSLWLADNLLFGAGKIHALKIGGLFEYEKRNTESAINQNGTFTFSSLNDFVAGNPTTFTQNPRTRKVNLGQTQIGGFIQDDMRLHKSFMLSAGLRYEWQNNLRDKNNFSPRLGFTWSPSKTGKISFRGGMGMYYNWLETNNLATVLSQDITQPSAAVIINPGYPNPLSGGVNQILPQSYWQLAENLKNPYIFLSSIGMETRLSETTSLRVLYKYQKGIHQFRSRDINAPLPDTLSRPDFSFGRVVQIESSAYFVQNSLNIGLNGRLNKRISYGIDYTLAKNTSDADGIFGLPSNNYDLRLDRSVSNLDQRHRIYASIFWRIRKGLSLSTNYFANSPLPYNITTGFDNNGDTIFNDRPLGILRNSERGTWQRQIDASLGWTVGFGKKDTKSGSVTIIAAGEEGDSEITANSRYSFRFYAATNNILNQTNFTNFVGVQTSPFFRQPVTADNPRRIQFGIRFSF